MAYGNGIFVAMGNGGLALSSSNGLIWSRRLLPIRFDANALAFGNGNFVAVGNDVFGCASVLISSDGVSWTNPPRFSQDCLVSLQALAFGGGRVVAVGNEEIFVSSDGITWTTGASRFNAELTSIAYAGGMFVAVGSDFAVQNVILTSSNGFGWTYQDYERDFPGHIQ